MDPVLIVMIGFVLLAVLAFFFARDSRPGFDHRELRDPGSPNVPSSPQPAQAED